MQRLLHNSHPRSAGAGARTPSRGILVHAVGSETKAFEERGDAVWSRKKKRKEKQHPTRGVGSRVRRGWSEVAWRGHSCIASDMRRRWQTGRLPPIAIRVVGKAALF
eukprot:3550907-Pleurochrysis_carterae.AAC.2